MLLLKNPHLIIERFGADKSDVLYIGDSYIDAETALNSGVDFSKSSLVVEPVVTVGYISEYINFK